MKEQIDRDEAEEHLINLIEDADIDTLFSIYKLVCNSSAKLIEEDGEFIIEVNYADEEEF